MSVDFAGWSVDQVVSWLRSINVTDETAELLRKNQVDGHCLRELTQEDLRDLGIVLGQYKKILRERDLMTGTASANSSSSSLVASSASATEEDDDLVPHSDLEPVRKLGGGHFGEVWLMMWCKTTKVAVKWLKGANTDEEFRKEIRLLRKIKHPHIVSYYGLSSDPATSVLRLVTEFVEGGSLLEWLREESSSYPQSCYFRVSQEICAGMEHISKKGIVHRDLAARNILVRKVAEKEVLVKLCDFGLGRVLDADTYYIRDATAIMPIKWSAPEALEFRKFSTKSDVFSFGVVMWEVWSHGADPYSGWPQTKILKRLKKGERLDIPYQCSDEVYALMMECWQLDAKLRPTWKELFEKLESLLANYEDKGKEEEIGYNEGYNEGSTQEDYGLSGLEYAKAGIEGTSAAPAPRLSSKPMLPPKPFLPARGSGAQNPAQSPQPPALQMQMQPPGSPRSQQNLQHQQSSGVQPQQHLPPPPQFHPQHPPLKSPMLAHHGSQQAVAGAAFHQTPPAVSHAHSYPQMPHAQQQPQHHHHHLGVVVQPTYSLAQQGYAAPPPQYHAQASPQPFMSAPYSPVPHHPGYIQQAMAQPVYANLTNSGSFSLSNSGSLAHQFQGANSPRASSRLAPFLSRIGTRCGNVKLTGLFCLDFESSSAGRGSTFEFLPSANGDGYYISTVVITSRDGSPQRCFLTVFEADGMRVGVTLASAEEPHKFSLTSGGILYIGNARFLFAENHAWRATKETCKEWEKVTLETVPFMDPATKVNGSFCYEVSFKCRLGSRRHNKMVCVSGEAKNLTFGDGMQNFEFIPNGAGNAYFIRALLPDEQSWFVMVDPQHGNVLRLAHSCQETDAFTVEADWRNVFFLRHLGSGKIVIAESRCMRADRDAKGDWEAFIFDYHLKEEVVPASRGSGRETCAKPSVAQRDANSAFILRSLEKFEGQKLWEKIAWSSSLSEAKQACQKSGKPLLLLMCTVGPLGAPQVDLGARLWRCTVLSSEKVQKRINADFIPFFLVVSKENPVPESELSCLTGHSRVWKSSPTSKKYCDTMNLIFVDAKSESHLLGYLAMVHMEDFETGFNPDVFLQKLAKYEKRIDDLKSKTGQGKLMKKIQDNKVISVSALLRYKKVMGMMENVLDEMSVKTFDEKK